MSSNLSIGYFFNQFNSAGNDNFAIYADMSASGNVIPNLTGVYSPTGIRASGNQYAYFQNTGSEVDYTNATYAMIYEKSGNGGATLISNVELVSGLYYQGFEFGITANNRLYFEYYSPNGPQVFSAPGNLSDKEAVFLTIFNNSVLMGSYDFYTNSVSNSIPFIIDGDYLFNPSGVYLGYNPKATGLYSYNKQLTGNISEFTIFSPSLYPLDVTYVMSGFVNNYSAPTNYINYINTTGITGYTTGITGYYTAVTGYSIIPTGVITNSFGITHTGYTSVPLSGTLSGSGVVALTGITQIATSGYSGESVSLDANKILSFGKSVINFLTPMAAKDVTIIQALTGLSDYSIEQNIPASYDTVNNSYYNSYLQSKNIPFLIYVDGLLQVSGNSYTSGSFYSPVVLPLQDYFINSSHEAVFLSSFSGQHFTFNGLLSNMIITTGFNMYSGSVYTGSNNNDYFWNGKLLNSGIDYTYSSGTLTFSENLSSGVGNLIYFNHLDPFSYSMPSSGKQSISSTKFATSYSNVYKNGLKLSLGSEYLEIATYDLNSGSGIFDVKSGLLYNSMDLS